MDGKSRLLMMASYPINLSNVIQMWFSYWTIRPVRKDLKTGETWKITLPVVMFFNSFSKTAQDPRDRPELGKIKFYFGT
jgi:hypothetical protein